MAKFNLVGQKFGRLMVLEEAPKKGAQRYWKCKCECGTIKNIQQAHLRNGTIVSCGCKRKEYESLIGKKFGRLTVIKEGKYDSTKYRYMRYWLCQCDCEDKKIVEIPYSNLANGNVKSCGCLLSESSSLNIRKGIEKKMKKKEQEMKEWIEENLIMREEAEQITGQSSSAFGQSVATGKIKAFIEFGNNRKTRLYLRSDVEKYANEKRKR